MKDDASADVPKGRGWIKLPAALSRIRRRKGRNQDEAALRSTAFDQLSEDGDARSRPDLLIRGWRALYIFWAGVAGALTAAGISLAVIGPPVPAPDPATPAPIAGEQEAQAPAAEASDHRRSRSSAASKNQSATRDADAGMYESTPHGRLPRIGNDGRESMRVFARPFDRADPRPRVALLVSGMGLADGITEDAIARLPLPVGLAFAPYSPRSQHYAARARERGMESLVALPMEPTNWPTDDPGDKALMTGLTLAENTDRLEWALARVSGYVGAVAGLGSIRGDRFAASAMALPLQDELRSRGLLYIDTRPGADGPRRAWGRSVDLQIDEPPRKDAVANALAELERIARERGSGLGLIGYPTPSVISALLAWADGLEARGLVLAPVSALSRRPEVPAQRNPGPAR